MATISPFAAVHYNPDRVTISDVLAPPYDVLSPADQATLYGRSPHNVVRLILNAEQPDDNPQSSRYTRAAEFLNHELAEGALVQDSSPALYVYVQCFHNPLQPSQPLERHALLAVLTLEPYERGVVLPHEETLPKAKTDRLNLMRATCANPEPIYGLYEDPTGEGMELINRCRCGVEPLIRAAYTGPGAADPEEHLLYRVDSPELQAALVAFIAPRRVWIADGHHRYETALNYQSESSAPGSSAILIGLTAFEDPGLVVLPTHRLVKGIAQARLDELALQLQRYFTIQITEPEDAVRWITTPHAGPARFVALLPHRGYLLTLRDPGLVDAAAGGGHCEAYRRLDVTALQALIMDRCLGIPAAELAATPDVAYTRDAEEALNRVRTGEFQVGLLLRTPSILEVRDVAAAGDKMPQKSTFFYPKLYSGVVVRLLSAEA